MLWIAFVSIATGEDFESVFRVVYESEEEWRTLDLIILHKINTETYAGNLAVRSWVPALASPPGIWKRLSTLFCAQKIGMRISMGTP